jgi:hypothetical protein
MAVTWMRACTLGNGAEIDYAFDGSISRPVLENYLARAITMNGMSYRAARYMEWGYEAIEFGQIGLTAVGDPEFRHLGDLLQRVRRHAAKKARRHYSLLNTQMVATAAPPVYEGILLFDFLNFPLRPKEVAGEPEKAVLELGHADTILGRSPGGVHPSGWKCEPLPYLVNFDQCLASGREGQPNTGVPWVWGYEKAAWLAHQTVEYRNAWLAYAHEWVRRTDSNGRLAMPGALPLTVAVHNERWYRANRPSVACPAGGGQEDAIKAIWTTALSTEPSQPNPSSKIETITPDFTTIVARDAGLWPHLQVTPDGTLLALGYNAPAHTTLPADVECWTSRDGGRTWASLSLAAPRPAIDANYCHWASGFTEKNELLVVASGMDDAANAHGKRTPNDVRVFRSSDFGKSWLSGGDFPKQLPGGLKPYPYGSIVRGRDDSVRTAVYAVDATRQNTESAWTMTSRDAGRTWENPIRIAAGINESVLMPLGGREWLCVARTSNKPGPEYGQELRQFRSADDGKTWTDEGLVAEYHQHPPHLLRLQDHRLLLTYGNRRDGSIEARFSANEGKTWSDIHKLYTAGPGDMGYPSTAQLPDGKLITVFYAAKSPLYSAYHMGVVGWTSPI